MNIMVIGKFYTEGFALHIAETLAAMGHSVIRFEAGLKTKASSNIILHRLQQVNTNIYKTSDSVPAIRNWHMRKFWQIVGDGPALDLVIVCYDFLWPEEVTKLKRLSSAKVVMWFPDAIANFSQAFFMVAPYDALFFKDPYIPYALGDVLPGPVYYLPECFNPAQHYLPDGEIPDKEYQCDIATAGNSHSWRIAFYQHLAQYNVKIWGPYPPLWMPPGGTASMLQKKSVFNQDKARAFLGAKVVLNNLHFAEVWGLNVRAFEAAGIGAFQMLNWRPGLAQLFEDGKEVVSFKNMSDLKTKIDYWLHEPQKRLEIAAAGKKRAYNCHTYQIRLQLLLDTISGKTNGYPIPHITIN